MLRLVLFFLPAALATLAVGQAVIPPGYEGIVEITNDTVADNCWPSINNHGQIVWSRRSDPYDDSTGEIWLYDNGAVTQLTHDYVRDSYPDINDAGDIVWSRGIGPPDPVWGWPTLEIMLYHGGTITRLTNDAYSDYGPRINENGWITWYKWTRGGCLNSDSDVYFYDGAEIRRITYGGYEHAIPQVNDLGDIVWTRYNNCNVPWTATIMLYSNGSTYELTGDDSEIQCPQINNRGLIAWRGLVDLATPGERVFLYQDGVTSELTDWGYNPYLNDRADVAFDRWHDDTQTWQVWLYRRGQFYQITDGSIWNFGGGIDAQGNFVFVHGDDYTVMTNIRLLKRRPPGDLNCDGAVNTFDIDPFVMALVNPEQYQAQYADCDATLADLNLDGSVNAFDIDPFVEVLTR